MSTVELTPATPFLTPFSFPVLDLVPFYPEWLWRWPSSPLHVLVSLRAWWAAQSGDPFFATAASAPANEAWFEAFLYVEALVQLPLTAYLVAELGSFRPTRGAAELAGLAYGCVTFMGAVACCAEIWRMGPGRVRGEHWGRLFWATYLPFCIVREFFCHLSLGPLPSALFLWGKMSVTDLTCWVAGIMAVDMYLRLLPRVRAPRQAKTPSRAS